MPPIESEMLEETIQLTSELRKLNDLIGRGGLGGGTAGDANTNLQYIQKDKAAKEAGIMAVKAFGQALSSTEQGLIKYTNAVQLAGTSVSFLTSNFGILGKAVGFAATIFSKLASTVLKYDQATLEATDSLSRMGVIGSLTSDQIRKMAISVGYNDDNIKKFAEVIKESGDAIVTLGIGASDSVKKFSEIMTFPEETKQRFRDMGLDIERANKMQASYIKTMVAGGSAFTDSIDSIRRQSVIYTKNLFELAALTGKDVETLAKQQEAAAADMQMQLEFLQLDQKIANAKTQQEKERYTREKQNLLSLSTIATEFGYVGQDLSAFMQLGLTGTVTELNDKIFTLLPELPKYFEGVKKGTITQGQLIEYMSSKTREMGMNFGDLARLTPELFTQLGLTGKGMEAAGKYANKSAKDLDDARKKTGNAVDDQAKQMRNAFEEMERRIQRAIDMFIQMISGPIRTGFMKFLDFMLSVMKGLAKWTDKLGMTTGLYASMLEGEEAEKLRAASIGKQEKLTEEINKRRARIDELGAQPRMSKADEREVKRLNLEIQDYQTQLDIEKTLVSQLDETKKMRKEISELNSILKPMSATDTNTQKLLDFIAKSESGGNYNILAGGKTAELTSMTIDELLKFQSQQPANQKAAGKYQIIPETLKSLMTKGIVKGEERFTPEVQERLGRALLDDAGYKDYIAGKMSKDEFADRVAAIWAAMPLKSGLSKYQGVAGNKALTGREQFMSMIPGASTGGAFFGSTEGYPVMLHGNEMVIPMNNITAPKKLELTKLLETVNENTNMTPTQTSTSTTTSGLEIVVNLLSEKLDMVIDKLERSVDTEEQILQYSRFRS